MIYLVAGDDFKRTRNAWLKYYSIFQTKQPAAGIFEFYPENFDPVSFEEVVVGETLFLAKHIVLARRLSENPTAKELVEKLLEKIAARPSVFLFFETGEDRVFFELLEKNAKETKYFKLPAKEKNDFNIFSLTDALVRRERQKLWVLYQQSLRSGIRPSDVFWKLIWQIKNMILVATAKDPRQTGLKPFVITRALAGSRNFSLIELKELLERLAELFDRTYPESDEFVFGLEKIILTI